jgi:hypothetical protein
MEDQEPSYGHDLSGLNDLEQSLIDSLQSEFADFSNSDAIADAPKHKKRSRKRKKTPKNVTPSVVSNTNYPAVISHTLNDDDTEEPSTNLVPINRKAQNSKYVKSFSGDNNLAKIGNSNIAVAKASSAGSANWRFGDSSNENNATADGGFLATISNFMSKFNSGGSGSGALSGVSVASTQPTPLQRQFLMILMHMRDTLDDIKDLLSTDGGKSGVKGIGLPKAADTKAGGSSFWDDLFNALGPLLSGAAILLASKFGPIVKTIADFASVLGNKFGDLGKDGEALEDAFKSLVNLLNPAKSKLPGLNLKPEETAAEAIKTTRNLLTKNKINPQTSEVGAETTSKLGDFFGGVAKTSAKFFAGTTGKLLKGVANKVGFGASLLFGGEAAYHGYQGYQDFVHGKKWDATAEFADAVGDAGFAADPKISMFGASKFGKLGNKFVSKSLGFVRRRVGAGLMSLPMDAAEEGAGAALDPATFGGGTVAATVGSVATTGAALAAPWLLQAGTNKIADYARNQQKLQDSASNRSSLINAVTPLNASPNSSITNNHNNLTINFPNAVVQSFDQVKDYINKALQQYDSAQKQLNSNNERFGNLGLPTTGNTLPFSTSGGGFGG